MKKQLPFALCNEAGGVFAFLCLRPNQLLLVKITRPKIERFSICAGTIGIPAQAGVWKSRLTHWMAVPRLKPSGTSFAGVTTGAHNTSTAAYAGWCSGRSRSLTVFTGLNVTWGTSTKRLTQSAIAPFQSPGSSKAFKSLPPLDFFEIKTASGLVY